MEDYEKKYKDVLAKAREIHRNEAKKRSDMEWLFPELKNNDEEIRGAIIDHLKDNNLTEWAVWLEKQGQTFTKKDVDDAYLKGISDAKNELEKQGEQKPFDYEHATITQKGFAPKPTEWSDEDENYLQSAENACEYQYGKNTSTILWLKSLKDRVRGKEDKHGNL